MKCDECNFARCACSYLKDLMTGKLGETTRGVALEQMGLDQPHRAGCPCPECWSLRAARWDQWAINMKGKANG